MSRFAAPLIACLACSGCVALWQDDHKIEASTGWVVTIEYDPLLLASDRVTTTAQSECGKFQRVAVLDHVRKGLTWTKITDFHCENEPVYLKGSIASLRPALPVAAPQAATSKVASTPAVPPVTESPVTKSQVASVRVIDASGANSAVTRRQVAKPQVSRTQTITRQVRSLPVATLKGSLVS